MCMISVIVPFYKGSAYIKRLMHQLNQASEEIVRCTDQRVQVILVNDSPGYDPGLSPEEYPALELVIMNHSTNFGIHQSRIDGLKLARGKYIHMIDQDDEISSSYYSRQLESIKSADLVYANGYRVQANGSRSIIYDKRRHQKRYRNLIYYLCYDNGIVSPGQCLIRRDAFSSGWKETVLKQNGADDLLLWISMLLEGKKFAFNGEVLYTHNGTGENASEAGDIMLLSAQEMVAALRETYGSNWLFKFLERRLKRHYEYNFFGVRHWKLFWRYPELYFFRCLCRLNIL